MFTGIIKTKGNIIKKINRGNSAEIEIKLDSEIKNPASGMSIAVNGVCLTASKIKNKFIFSADISEETLNRTTFKKLKTGDKINIEFPLTVNDFLSGHIVQGHIDTTGKVFNITKKADNTIITFEVDKEYNRYLVEKGSIAIDGVSLTMFNIKEGKFDVAIIPETLKQTIICDYKKGTNVNIEFDIIGKYVEKILNKGK